MVHGYEPRFRLADGTRVKVIGHDDAYTSAMIVREGSEGYGLVPHFAAAYSETVPFGSLTMDEPEAAPGA